MQGAVRSWAIATLALLACSPESGAPERAAAAPPDAPNVVVIAIDTLRPDHLGLYGYPRETAPFLRSLGEQSVVFRNAVSSSSWTAPATASLFTGRYPAEHGVLRGFYRERKRIRSEQAGDEDTVISMNSLPADTATLAEVFRAGGYETFGITANINVGPELGFDRGFDRFERMDTPDSKAYPDAEQVLDRLVPWLEDVRAAKPYFLYLHFNDPHGPQVRRQPWFGEPGPADQLPIQEYDSEISYLDSFLGRLDEFLDLRSGVTLVVSDHGQAFGEHGALGHGPNTGLYAEVNRILLMIHAPGLSKPGVSHANVSIVDVLPTLCELAGLPAPAAASGVSLVPLLAQSAAGAERFAERPLFAHVLGDQVPVPTRAVIRGPWKLVHGHAGVKLYDLANDPRELRDAASDRPEIVAALTAELEREPKAASRGKTVDVQLDEAELEQLRALGYAQ
jgi:arylsulfatase A-like enzyme